MLNKEVIWKKNISLQIVGIKQFNEIWLYYDIGYNNK